MKINGWMIVCVAWLAFMVGNAAGSVGRISETAGEPYPWYLPILMAGFTFMPMWLGYQAGKAQP